MGRDIHIGFFKRNLEREPTHWEVRGKLALYHLASGHPSIAEKHFRAMLDGGARRGTILDAINEIDDLLERAPHLAHAPAMRELLKAHSGPSGHNAQLDP